MNAVIDEDLHRSLGKTLTSLGFIIFDIRDLGMRGKSDDTIYRFAQKKKSVLFSADLGFSNTIRYPLGTHYGIVILRFPNELSTNVINQQVKLYLARLIDDDYQGNTIIVSPGKIRIRRRKNSS